MSRLRPAVALSLLILLGAVPSACSYDIESPALSSKGVSPDLVCAEEIDTPVTLNGTGFTPMPSKTLESTTQLLLPQVALTETEDLTGKPVSGKAVDVPDDPANPSKSQLHWTSETQMEFTVTPGLLTPGIYDIEVTNPDGKHTASFKNSLAAVPRPKITTVGPIDVCDAEANQTITLQGASFLEVGTTLPSVTLGGMAVTPSNVMISGCMPIPLTFSEGKVSECTGLTITIPKGSLPPGTYPIVVTNPPPADCKSSETVDVTVVAPPTVSSVVPKTICQGGGDLTVDGMGFTQGSTVSLESTGQPTVMSSSSTTNMAGTQIDATFGGPFTVGSVYDVVVNDGVGCTDTPPHQQVTVIPGPIAFFADPDVVYNNINTLVTIYMTALMPNPPPGAPATVTITPAGMTTPVTTLTGVVVVPGHPNRLQAVVPSGTPPGTYDLHVSDASGCPTTLPTAIEVTSTTTIALGEIVPPFGWTMQETPVTIFRAANPPAGMMAPFVATPRVFLNPTNGGSSAVAIQLQSVSFVDMSTLTAVVPPNEPTGLYDLVVVNPDKTVGFLPMAFTVQSAEPPTIGTVTPSSIVNATGQAIVVAGQAFNGSTITMTCENAMGMMVASPNVTSGAVSCTASGCTQSATVDGSTLAPGDICVVRVTNADGSYFDYSAVGVTGPSLNTPATSAGTSLNVGRRALVAAAGNATASARFIYAIGGDGGSGMAGAPFGSTEFTSVDLFGKMGSWQLQPDSTLNTARSFAAYASIGRYIYVAGGSDGTNALQSAERAMILSPLEAPALDIDDLVPNATGLQPGYWFYRVSATFDAADPDNPGGESLASDEFIVKVPTFAGKLIQVVLAWSAPVDSQGKQLPNVAGYNVYRTPMVNGTSGGEVLLATVSGTTLTYTDDGTGTPGTQQPLPLGSTGKWAQLPAMATARRGAAGAAGRDPSSPSQIYFYALLGVDQAGTASTSYEYLTITEQPNGHHTVGAWSTGLQQSSAGRQQLGAFVADATVFSSIPAGTTYVYLGGGADASGAISTTTKVVEAGKIGAGGDLGTLALEKGFTNGHAGYGVCAANDQLFVFGGANAAPSNGAESATLITPVPALANNGWNSEGTQLVQPRYLMGSTVQSAFIFLVAGDTGGGTGSKTTETVIW